VIISESQESELIKSVGSTFKADGLKTKWLVGDTSNLDAAVPYISAILSHASVLPYVGAISCHTWYSDGLPDSSFAAVATLAKQYDVLAPANGNIAELKVFGPVS
jgi:hypothetical protein